MLQRRVQRRGELLARNPDPAVKSQVHDRRRAWLGAGRSCSMKAFDSWAHGWFAQLRCEFGDVSWGESSQGGQVVPLVLVGFECCEVEEDRRALLAAIAVQRCGDEVPDPVRREHVLGREQPVIATQFHATPDCDRLAHQSGPELAGRRRRNGFGEEDPHVRTDTGPRDLQRRRCADGSRRLEIGQRIQHRGLAIEVRRQPAGPVPWQHRVQPDVVGAGQMHREHLKGQL